MTTSSVFAFNRAIMRAPARSVIDGLRAVDRGAPDFDGVVREQAAYAAALERAGVSVSTLPALEMFPDSIFVEDAALVFSEGAILMRPGAPSRAGEVAEIAPALNARFENVLEVQEGSADGGDVLVTSNAVLIGLSARTNRAGAEALSALLTRLGRAARIVTTPAGVLHFKSDCALLDEETVLATRRLAASGVFAGMRVLETPEGEEAAANALRVNARLFVSAGFPRTADVLDRAGYALEILDTREIAKIDAGLSCLSLRWLG